MTSEAATNSLLAIEGGTIRRPALTSYADIALRRSAALWFFTTAAGQWIFVFYIAAYHGSLLLQKGLKGMDETSMPQGYIAGDALGNATLALHIVLAALIIGGGTLQLVPQIRARFPVFHRWNGRIYIAAVVLTSVGGIYLTWSRTGGGSILQEVAISLNGVLMLLFAAIAVRHAVARNIRLHRRWALRLFMLVSAPWFLRIGYTLWFFVADRIGIEVERIFDFLNFGQFLVPLLLLECYLRAQDRMEARGRLAMATALLIVTGMMGFGVYLATTQKWLPHGLS